jgi:CRP/FNR family transcriptional regulator
MHTQGLDKLPSEHPCAGCEARLRTFCAALDAGNLQRLKCLGSTVRIGAHEPLFHEGDAADTVYNLTSGTLKLYKLLSDGRRQIMGFLQPGDFLGITIDDEHAFSAEAIDPVEVCRFSRARFDAFVEDHPRVERELYRLAAHELGMAQEQMILLGRKTALERVASFLLGLLKRQKERGVAGDTVALQMNRLDIADYLGLTKETVSRVFTSLKTSGVIRLLAEDRVAITDRGTLETLASGA